MLTTLPLKRAQRPHPHRALTCALICCAVSSAVVTSASSATSAAAQPAPALGAPRPCDVSRTDFRSAYERVSPSVVSVAAGRVVSGRFESAQRGTGVVIGEGLVLTNAHVIGGSVDVRVRTYERRVVKMWVVGQHEPLDIALLVEQNAGALGSPPPVALSGAPVETGAWVAAIGHPYDLPHSLSVGVVSGFARNSEQSEWRGVFPGFIQTDLPLNVGNSGGPLINACGEMVGLNTQVKRDAQGLSFSLPNSRLLAVLSALKGGRPFSHSRVGLTLKYVSFQRGRRAGVPPRAGVRVQRVKAGGAAARAGLRPNDIILSLNGAATDDVDELNWSLVSSPAGVPLSLSVARPPEAEGGAPQRLTLTLTPDPSIESNR